MLTYARALALAEAWVRTRLGDRARIDQNGVVKKPCGWVFLYQSVAFLETKNPLEMLAGNAPIIVDRIDGELRVTGTARPVQDYLASTRRRFRKRT